MLWHLTPSGWVSGGSVLTAAQRDRAVPPPDRLETWEASYEVCSQYDVPVGVIADRIWPPPMGGTPFGRGVGRRPSAMALLWRLGGGAADASVDPARARAPMLTARR